MAPEALIASRRWKEGGRGKADSASLTDFTVSQFQIQFFNKELVNYESFFL